MIFYLFEGALLWGLLAIILHISFRLLDGLLVGPLTCTTCVGPLLIPMSPMTTSLLLGASIEMFSLPL